VDRVSSEVPGDVTARVTEPVYAEAAGPGDGPLLPIGTKLVGSYKQTRLEPSRRRLDFTWQYAELPGGRTVRLGDAFGQDAGGAAGVTGKVDMHWGDLWLTGLILVTTGAVEYGTNSTAAAGGDIADAIGASAGREGGRLARETAARTLNLEPTITIRPGALITVRPRKMVRVC
jgi:type IV secretion system protein TrbI